VGISLRTEDGESLGDNVGVSDGEALGDGVG